MVTRYVNPDADIGGNGTTNALTGPNCAYRSLNAAETALPADITGIDAHEIVCETAGSADTTAVTFYGTTTDATHFVQVRTSAAHRHAGVWNDAKYRLTTTATAITYGLVFLRIFGLQIKVTSSSGGEYGVLGTGVPTGAVIHIGYNLIKAVLSGTAQYATAIGESSAASGSRTVYLYNNIICDWVNGTNECRAMRSGEYWTNYIYNNTVHNCRIGYMRALGIVVAKNCIANDCNDGFSGAFDGGSDYNASDISGDAPGAHSRNGADGTITFVDEAGDNFHLAAGDTNARDRGVADPGAGLFGDDIDGQARGATWDIGADEYVVSGGVVHEIAGTAAGTSTATCVTRLSFVLAGSAQGLAAGQAMLAARRALAGSSAGAATSAGAVRVSRGLRGAAAATSLGSATLAVVRGLAGTAAARAVAAGVLAVCRALAGAAAGAARATAILTVRSGTTRISAERTAVVIRESRIAVVDAENRIARVAPENRTVRV